ncbi:hypothetical protein F8M41_024523 [Gigaspora margarita]|uniref:Uncharacterized protein n=1 Tax=Gigaspora margarita TaxID=4874 RepID=A0A8H3XMG1_GIGMA|nr:hypothetical protein F8M41_024523 [Gigaspora margarita]
MDSDPQKRPTADNLIDKFWEWCDIMRYPDDLDVLDDIDDNDNVMHRFSIEHFCCFMTWCFQIFTGKNKTDEKAVNNNDSKNNADDNIDEDDNDNYADEEVNSENNANDNADEEEDYNKIKKQFLDADKRIQSLQINLPKNPDTMYTSKMINTKKISMAINASKSINHGEILNSNYYSTKQNLLLISNDF